MSITATVENGSIKLPREIHVPDGTSVQVTLPEQAAASAENPFGWMDEFIGCIDTLPPDFAREHDHYIHGGPKREQG